MERTPPSYLGTLLSELISSWQLNNSCYPFLRARFQKFLKESPKDTFDTLFFVLYLKHPVLSNFSSFRSFLQSHVSCLYPGIIVYTRHLKKFQQLNELENPSLLILREIRYLCREILLLALNDAETPYPTRKQLHKAIQQIHPDPPIYESLPFCKDEVIANLPFYLEKADLLAELPQFSPIYFTTDELSCFLNSLQSYRLTQENEASLEKLLSALRKKQILSELLHFTRTFPLIHNAKQAFAIYISLGEIIPWTRHPFIRRLLAVSHQEAKVSLYLKNLERDVLSLRKEVST